VRPPRLPSWIEGGRKGEERDRTGGKGREKVRGGKRGGEGGKRRKRGRDHTPPGIPASATVKELTNFNKYSLEF